MHSDKEYKLPRPLKIGDEVQITSLGKAGTVLEISDKNDSATVQAGIIKTRVPLKELRLIEGDSAFFIGDDKKKKSIRSEGKSLSAKSFSPEIDLRGENGEDGWFILDRYLDDAKMAGVKSVTVVHGKGTGALKKALWQFMKNDKRIKSYRLGMYGEGDGGVTVVELK